MKSSTEILAYWPERRESLDACTDRLYEFLHEIGHIEPTLAKWYEKGWTREDALQKRISLDRASLRAILDNGRNRRDMDGSVIEELGFHRDLWNGGRLGASASMVLLCGAYTDIGSNLVHIRGDAFDRGIDLDTALGLIHAAVRCWQPEWACVCSSKAADELNHGLHEPYVDWIFFHRLRRRRRLPPPARVAFELDGGECIVVQDEPVDFDDPAQRARSLAVARVLGL